MRIEHKPVSSHYRLAIAMRYIGCRLGSSNRVLVYTTMVFRGVWHRILLGINWRLLHDEPACHVVFCWQLIEPDTRISALTASSVRQYPPS
ncbi:hypothetical protein KIN20_007342 [Parelaphostrongylus tenuis]|uniref:Uncharacterized protein n=1 Tax=Parelaphostrongylus tenuis TaxID=148309 RepID=A0AAD5MM29_PARTN|nr:hypothetical protein KIN20_007342 [Parelaphostrongylus tenuis]